MKNLLYKKTTGFLLLAFLALRYSCKSDNEDIKFENITSNMIAMMLKVEKILSIITFPLPSNIINKII